MPPPIRCQLCVSLAEEDGNALLQQVERAVQWADLIEIRLDKLKKVETTFLQRLQQRAGCPIIWTLRQASHGGFFKGTEEERWEIWRSLSPLASDFIDVESDTPSWIFHQLHQLFPHTQWIISWHHSTSTPFNLEAIYQTMVGHPATYYKMVTFAQNSSDALRMLNFTLKQNKQRKNFCGICMGARGQVTRLLSPVVGSPLAFACLEKGKETAPGQLTAEELVTLYRFRELNQETQLLGLIGRPVDKSLSALTHQAVLKELALNAIYLPFHLEDDDFLPFFNEIKSLPIRGLSVTMPFKEKVLSLLRAPHSLAACNTLVWTTDGWHGHNTDGMGALKALGFASLKGKKIVILGAGGTAKAIAQAAHQQGAHLIILNRTVERAKQIAQPLHAQWGALERFQALHPEEYEVVIQATCVGMAPAKEQTPILGKWIAPHCSVLEVICDPAETRLLREAKKEGCRIIAGKELFIQQAVEQFACWFGQHLPKEQIEEILRQRLFQHPARKCARVQKSSLKGEVHLPPSKSHTIRAILLAAFAKGTSHLRHLLASPDTHCAIQAVQQLGAKVTATSQGWAITGVAGYPQVPSQVIDAGNSGQVLRFVGALAALADGYTILTGDESIRSNRPIQPLIEGLTQLKAWAVSTRRNGYAPLIVKGPLQPGVATLEGQDSQPVSALLMAAAFVEGKTDIHVLQAGEKPWLNVTLSWLDRLGVNYVHHNFEHFTIDGQRVRPAFEITIPGDLSSLAFPVAAALVTQSTLVIHHVCLQDVQGDKEVMFLLQRMGAQLEIDADKQLLSVHPTKKLKGQVIDVNPFIDAVPILAVLGCYAQGETQLVNASIARCKESNRLACIVKELKKMGAIIEETEDGLKVRHSPLKGACVESYDDHRLALSLIVAALGAEGQTKVQGIECIHKSYPTFLQDLSKMGAIIDEKVE